jgi:hypothetical protein
MHDTLSGRARITEGIAAEVDLAGKKFVTRGWARPVALHDTDAPWYRYVRPRYSGKAGLKDVSGLSDAEIAKVKIHEGNHLLFYEEHPQLTYLIHGNPKFPGSGFAKYFLEYRAYKAAGQLESLATPFRSFSAAQMRYFKRDVAIAGAIGVVGTGSLLYYLCGGGQQ